MGNAANPEAIFLADSSTYFAKHFSFFSSPSWILVDPIGNSKIAYISLTSGDKAL